MTKLMWIGAMGVGAMVVPFIAANAGESCCKKKAAQAAAVTASAEEAGKGCCPKAAAALKAELTKVDAYGRADELLASWDKVPAKLASMTEGDRAGISKAGAKASDRHPGMQLMPETMTYLSRSLAAARKMDCAAAKMCAAASAEKASAEGEPQCPVTAAAMASAKTRFQTSAALVAKADALLVAAGESMSGGCGGEGKQASGEGQPCAKTAALASAEGEPKSGCCKKKEAVTASADGEKKCAKTAAALAAAEGEPKSGCCKKKEAATASADGEKKCAKTAAALTAAEGEPKSGCCKKKEAVTASADGEKKCPKAAAAAALAAAEDGEPCEKVCAKTLAADAEKLVSESGVLLARWELVASELAAMSAEERSSATKAVSSVMSECPIGALMPGTLATVAELLDEAARLDAQCKAESRKHPEMAKMIPEDLMKLHQARCLVISSARNVLNQSGVMGPKGGERMAAAQ